MSIATARIEVLRSPSNSKNSCTVRPGAPGGAPRCRFAWLVARWSDRPDKAIAATAVGRTHQLATPATIGLFSARDHELQETKRPWRSLAVRGVFQSPVMMSRGTVDAGPLD